jgi:hypothetical protein
VRGVERLAFSLTTRHARAQKKEAKQREQREERFGGKGREGWKQSSENMETLQRNGIPNLRSATSHNFKASSKLKNYLIYL